MTSLLPFGVQWPATPELKARCVRERAAFAAWIDDLDVPDAQRHVLTVLLGFVAEAEMVDGRCAGVTYSAEVARRVGGSEDVDSLLHELVSADYLTVHPAADVFEDDKRPGIVFRIRRPDIVLTFESAGLLWRADSWPIKRTA